MSDEARAVRAIEGADAILVTAGAGMGVDSGLPDFRGNEGFWRAYPPMRALGLSLPEMANPRWFARDPALAWGFYGHRLGLYRRTKPHVGFGILRRLMELKSGFVFTSNVDGQFQRAGFDPARIVECHGAIDFLQCMGPRCDEGIFPADTYEVVVDETTFRAAPPLPRCPRCGSLARPNILMFGDGGWDGSRTEAQERAMEGWLAEVGSRRARLVVIECGAGLAVPTVRMVGERLVRASGATLVRINPRDGEVPHGQISVSAGARAALVAIGEALGLEA